MKILSKPFVAWDTAWKQWNKYSDFQKARIQLTALYLGIFFVLLNLFTGAIFWMMQNEEQKHIQVIETAYTQKEIFFPNQKITILQVEQSPKYIFDAKEIQNLQHSFLEILQKKILWIEFILLFCTGFLSYFLSGRTLKPIEEKNKKQAQFLADVSHELKNPLSALKTTAEISAQQQKWKTGEIQEVFSDMEEEISRLIRITEDLLDLENTKNQQKKSEISADTILKNTLHTLEKFAKQKNIIFQKKIENFSLFSTQKELEMIFFNLVHNAIKFSEPHASLEISLESSGKFSVCNTGTEISQKDLPRIFDRFYKAESARTFSEENSSGLGLSLVKKICDENGWKIFVKSSEGKTRFEITF